MNCQIYSQPVNVRVRMRSFKTFTIRTNRTNRNATLTNRTRLCLLDNPHLKPAELHATCCGDNINNNVSKHGKHDILDVDVSKQDMWQLTI